MFTIFYPHAPCLCLQRPFRSEYNTAQCLATPPNTSCANASLQSSLCARRRVWPLGVRRPRSAVLRDSRAACVPAPRIHLQRAADPAADCARWLNDRTPVGIKVPLSLTASWPPSPMRLLRMQMAYRVTSTHSPSTMALRTIPTASLSSMVMCHVDGWRSSLPLAGFVHTLAVNRS